MTGESSERSVGNQIGMFPGIRLSGKLRAFGYQETIVLYGGIDMACMETQFQVDIFRWTGCSSNSKHEMDNEPSVEISCHLYDGEH